MSSLRLLIIPLMLAAAPRSASADFSQYSCHTPATQSIEAIIDDNACVGYHVKAADGSIAKTVRFPFKGSGKLIASADGRTVVMLQSYLPGHADPKGNIVEEDGATSTKNPIGIHVFRDGVSIATHRVGDLVLRKHLVSSSISHVRWIREAPDTLGSDTFVIATTSYRVVTFDTKTGAIRRKRDAPQWDRCDDIVTGKLDLPQLMLTNTYSLKTKQRASAITFVRDPGVALTNNATTTACLERRGRDLVLTEVL